MVNTAIPPITPTETRYWYNSITQGCEPFSFNPDANQGNANSFLTLDFCLSYCASGMSLIKIVSECTKKRLLHPSLRPCST